MRAPHHLKALRALEAAARLGSFRAAAEELFVTPGAIAQQVRLLEDWLGRPLFKRTGQGVIATDVAAATSKRLSDGFELIASALDELRIAREVNAVRICTLPCIAQLWLSPLLHEVRRSHPAIEISIRVFDDTPSNLSLDDVGIFYSPVPSDTFVDTVLCGERLFPVCSPRLRSLDPVLEKPADLSRQVLLHDETWRGDWAYWGRAAGVSGCDFTRGPTFSLYVLALQAALDGAGILMARETLVTRYLDSGELLPFFSYAAPAPPLRLSHPQEDQLTEAQLQFVGWLKRRFSGHQGHRAA